MTGRPHRDFEPPEGDPAAATVPWELWLGSDLEQCYQYFAELHWVFVDIPDELIEQLTELRRWMLLTLRRLHVPELLVDAADQAVADVRLWTRVEVFTDATLNRRRRAIRDTFELLLQLTRCHMTPGRRRYFDFGVMLYRVNGCAIMERIAPGLPPEVHQAWPGLQETYRRELWNCCATLVSFVREEEPGDAEASLEADFRAFADYLEERMTAAGPPDAEFLRNLQTISFNVGLFASAKAALGRPGTTD